MANAPAPVINFTLPPDITPPPCLTRTTHTIRITSKNKKFFADIEILDAFSVMLPNNTQLVFELKAKNPLIIDTTGDNNGRTPLVGFGISAPSRKSHMQRITSPTDPTAYFDAEVCDGFTVVGPNDAEFFINCPGPGQYPPNPQALGALPQNNIYDSFGNQLPGQQVDGVYVNPAIIDNSGAGLSVPATEQSTRAQHVMAYARQVTNGNSGTNGIGQIANPADYILVLLTDAIIFTGPKETQGHAWQVQPDYGGSGDVRQFVDQNVALWYAEHVMFTPNLEETDEGVLFPGINTNDTTEYVIDPRTKQKVPPPPDPNEDLNNFIFFPDDMVSPFLGAGIAVDMGPIWWIRQLGALPNVWFWYINPIQQPMAWSFFGVPPEAADVQKWGYRGFVWLPDFPVSWIQEVNYPLVPLGLYGSNSLETAALGVGGSLGGDGSSAQMGTVNWYGYGISPMNVDFPPSTSVFAGGQQLGDTFAVAGGTENPFVQLTYVLGTFMPYGGFDLIAGTAAEMLAYVRQQGGNTTLYTQYGGPTPNIWELTGLSQPPLKTPKDAHGNDLPWNPITNPHLQPTLAQATEVVQTFISNWNSVANATNKAMAAQSGGTTLMNPGVWPFIPPPGWKWNRPYGGDSLATAQQFSNGWIPAVFSGTTVPAYIPTLAADQLDPTVWDLQTSLDTGNPPELWAVEFPPTGQ